MAGKNIIMVDDLEAVLRDDPTEWLLERNNPSVRYFTLRDIVKKPEDDPELKQSRQEIMNSETVVAILEKQKEEGYWETPENFYNAKYKGTVWQLIILAELGASIPDKNIKAACEFILNNSQDSQSGGFAHSVSVKKGGGRHSEVIPCLTGNMVWSLIRLGYFNDTRVQQGINWITKYQRFDDGTRELPAGWPYDRLKAACFGKHTCHMGAVKALKALAEIPGDKRSSDVKNTIENGSEYFLKHNIYKKSHDLKTVSKPGWLKFGFPLMYQTDVLEVLEILTRLGCKDERMKEAVDVLISRQNSQGRWELKNTFNGRFQVNIEQKDKPSKWVTLNALRVLKRLYS